MSCFLSGAPSPLYLCLRPLVDAPCRPYPHRLHLQQTLPPKCCLISPHACFFSLLLCPLSISLLRLETPDHSLSFPSPPTPPWMPQPRPHHVPSKHTPNAFILLSASGTTSVKPSSLWNHLSLLNRLSFFLAAPRHLELLGQGSHPS